MPGRNFQSATGYRYGFNGKESDFEIHNSGGTSYDYGARMYDPRLGRWFSCDRINKSFVSPYNFVQNNPTNFIDPDGNDEIHFYYTTHHELDVSGVTQTIIKISSEIIKDGRNELTFFVHPDPFPGTKPLQFFPFLKNSNIANDFSHAAAGASLPFSKESFLFGMGTFNIDDHTYLGILLGASPEILQYYKDNPWAFYLRGAQKKAQTFELTKALKKGTEIAYAVIDGYVLLRGATLFSIKTIVANGGLKPLGLGASTGRTIAANEFEANAMREILANPSLGKPIQRLSPMKDKSGTWDGWSKMYYNYIGEGGKKFQIHFNAAFDDTGKMIKIDDFKFKDH